jgi:hypothetical protein
MITIIESFLIAEAPMMTKECSYCDFPDRMVTRGLHAPSRSTIIYNNQMMTVGRGHRKRTRFVENTKRRHQDEKKNKNKNKKQQQQTTTTNIMDENSQQLIWSMIRRRFEKNTEAGTVGR